MSIADPDVQQFPNRCEFPSFLPTDSYTTCCPTSTRAGSCLLLQTPAPGCSWDEGKCLHKAKPFPLANRRGCLILPPPPLPMPAGDSVYLICWRVPAKLHPRPESRRRKGGVCFEAKAEAFALRTSFSLPPQKLSP